jgi:lysine-N-methylase
MSSFLEVFVHSRTEEKLKKITKLEIYDKFKCSADQCPFTCCEDWEIEIDLDTYTRWEGNNKISTNLSETVKMNKSKHKSERYIKMNSKKLCPYLSSNQLCTLVLNQGEDYIPLTCRTFPRVINTTDELQELSLSCACPEVVDMFRDIDKAVKFLDGSNTVVPIDSSETELRHAIISLLQKKGYSLRNRILLCFQILLEIRLAPVNQKEILEKYEQEQYLQKVEELWKYSFDKQTTELWKNTFTEVSELFLDIVQNYRRRRKYKEKLKDIADLAEELLEDQEEDSIINYATEYATQFQFSFEQYDKLFEHCLVTKVFANCCSDNVDDTIMAFQIMITEYVMTKYSAFLKYKLSDNSADLYRIFRDYIVVYSRIIEYNMEGMKEFWAESFEEANWEMGYLLLLLG